MRLECLPRGDAVLRLFHWVTQADDNLAFFSGFLQIFPGFSRKHRCGHWHAVGELWVKRVYTGKSLINFWNGQGQGRGLDLKRSFVVVGKDGGEAVKEDPQVVRVEGQTRSQPGDNKKSC